MQPKRWPLRPRFPFGVIGMACSACSSWWSMGVAPLALLISVSYHMHPMAVTIARAEIARKPRVCNYMFTWLRLGVELNKKCFFVNMSKLEWERIHRYLTCIKGLAILPEHIILWYLHYRHQVVLIKYLIVKMLYGYKKKVLNSTIKQVSFRQSQGRNIILKKIETFASGIFSYI